MSDQATGTPRDRQDGRGEDTTASTPETTGDERLDALLARLQAQAERKEAQQQAESAGERPLRAPESAEADPPRGTGHPEPDGLPLARAETRLDPILPAVTSVREHPARVAGRLAFGGLIAADREVPDAQLPLLPAPEGPRVPLLELVDAYGIPTTTRGRGAPLDLAVYIAACILTPYHLRESRGMLVTTVRQLRDFLFGPTWRPSSTAVRSGDWERVRTAALRANDLWLPLPNGDLWRALAVWRIPPADYRPGYLDREVIFEVKLPAGAAHGPVIDRLELARLRLVSGPRFRAYIAAHSVAWRPGITRRPHPHNRRVHLWSTDPRNYPVLTTDDRDRLAFGTVDRARKEGRPKADGHWEDLSGVEIVDRKASTPDGRVGWLIVPEAAAEAIRGPTQPGK